MAYPKKSMPQSVKHCEPKKDNKEKKRKIMTNKQLISFARAHELQQFFLQISDAEGFEDQGPLLAFTIYDPWEKFDVTVYLTQENRTKLKALL